MSTKDGGAMSEREHVEEIRAALSARRAALARGGLVSPGAYEATLDDAERLLAEVERLRANNVKEAELYQGMVRNAREAYRTLAEDLERANRLGSDAAARLKALTDERDAALGLPPAPAPSEEGGEPLPLFRAGEEIDITGGVDSAEFIRRQRDGE